MKSMLIESKPPRLILVAEREHEGDIIESLNGRSLIARAVSVIRSGEATSNGKRWGLELAVSAGDSAEVAPTRDERGRFAKKEEVE